MDNTDGCAKQYRCGKAALWLLTLLAYRYRIITDRAIGAPGQEEETGSDNTVRRDGNVDGREAE